MANRRATDRRAAAPGGWAARLRALWQTRGLALQSALLLPAATALPGALLWAGVMAGAWAWPVWPLPVWLGLAAAWLALVAAWWGHQQAQAWLALGRATRPLRHDPPADDAQLPWLPHHAQMREASAALRRMVAMAQAQRQALQARNAQLGQQLQQRTHELSTLADLSVGLADSGDLFELVDEALKALASTLDYTSASVWARDRRGGGAQVVLAGYHSRDPAVDDGAGTALRGQRLSRSNLQRYEQIEAQREPLIDNDARQGLLSWLWEKVTDDARSSALYRSTRSWMALPMRFREVVMGVMRVDHDEAGYFDAERARLLRAVSSQAALAMHHAQLLVQARDVAVATERHRIARDLHDAVSQTLFASNVIAGTLTRQAAEHGDSAQLATQARTLERLNRGALAEMRMLLYELRPDALDSLRLDELLAPPIEALACRGDMQVSAQLGTGDALPPATRLHLYRMAQEALSNASRHSAARQVVVEWQPQAPDGALLRIHDDGQGFDPQASRAGHFGLDNLASRALELGAQLHITSQPGQGCEIRVQLPLHSPPAPPA
jgi:signal transduction histidine kinase